MKRINRFFNLKSCQYIFLALTSLHIVGLFILQDEGPKIYSVAENNVIANGLREFISSNVTSESPSSINSTIKLPSSEIFQWSNSSTEKDDFSKNYIWEESNILPQWMKDYFAWHCEQRRKLNKSNWKDFKFMVMRCLGQDSKCGGTADRIKTIPYVLYWAARTKRIIMIHWSRPAALEEFLVPPEGGIDWRVPSWLVEDVVHGRFIAGVAKFEKFLAWDNQVAVRSKLQSYNGGSIFYNEMVDGPSFEEIYHDVWKTFFTPSSPLQKILTEQMNQFGIRAGSYASAHLRGLYAIKDRKPQTLRRMSENALKCASNLRPEGPIYFASDSKVAVDHVVSIAPRLPIKIVAIQRDYEPLHLEKASNWENRSASEFYDTFVDLYLIAMSKCVTYNMGGYGQWGLWISQNSSCYKEHGDRTRLTFHCDWTTSIDKSLVEEPESNGTPFLAPMGTGLEENIGNDPLNSRLTIEEDEKKDENELHKAAEIKNHTILPSQNVPKWMRDYFLWHSQTKESLTKENWKNTNYLVMQCRHSDAKCGGVSDRLRPMPFMMLLAARSQRLLLIQWSKPFPLEEFLLPPTGGLNWTVPNWLAPDIEDSGRLFFTQQRLLSAISGKQLVVRARYQSNNYGSVYFNNQTENEVSFEDVYHDLFSFLFTPSPPVSEIITQKMNQMQISPGEYSAAHFRVLYGRDFRPEEETKRVAINAINCASELRPGGPVYFAADHKVAVDHVQEYSKQHNLPVVSLQHTEEPLHLDLSQNWTERSPSEYYATFVDLLILGQSRCLAYSNGGYGTFGLVLGFNASCSVRYFSKKIIKSCPKWINA